MRKKARAIALVISLGMACLCLGSSLLAPAAVPPDVSIGVPDPSLPEEVTSVLGKWVGNWNSLLGWDSALYVEKIEGNSAQVVFAWGEYITSRNSYHYNPNWVRIQNARVTRSYGRVALNFYTPMLRSAWLKASHTVSGSADERWGERAGSTGVYTYSFVVNKSELTIMKGQFISARSSHLSIAMKKIAQADNLSE